jgi:dTDP-4-amino-4,6-dideoxygalactose transaminase
MKRNTKHIPLVDLRSQYRSIKGEIDAAIASVIRSSAFIRGAFLDRFERDFARAIGAKHCIGVGNGTDALVISLRALGVGLGDEVIVPANSFIATSEAVTLAGAKVVFVGVRMTPALTQN